MIIYLNVMTDLYNMKIVNNNQLLCRQFLVHSPSEAHVSMNYDVVSLGTHEFIIILWSNSWLDNCVK